MLSINNEIQLINHANNQQEIIKLLNKSQNFDYIRNYLMDNYDIDWTGDYFIDEQLPLYLDTLKENIIKGLKISVQ